MPSPVRLGRPHDRGNSRPGRSGRKDERGERAEVGRAVAVTGDARRGDRNQALGVRFGRFFEVPTIRANKSIE